MLQKYHLILTQLIKWPITNSKGNFGCKISLAFPIGKTREKARSQITVYYLNFNLGSNHSTLSTSVRDTLKLRISTILFACIKNAQRSQ